MKAFIYAETAPQMSALCGCARAYADAVEAVAIGDELKDAALADKVFHIATQAGVMVEDYTETIADLIANEQPDFVFIETTRRNKLIAGRIAALLGTSVMTDVIELAENGTAKHLVYGGAATRTEKATGPVAIYLLGSDVLPNHDAQGANEIVEVPFITPVSQVKCRSVAKKEKSAVNLSASQTVVGIGRGIAKEDDLVMIRAFADAIEGEVGCTRPIAEEEKWLPREVYIGVSGVMLAPEVYVAIGLSGQVQHTVGINRAKTIIAINKEASAPIFKQADYGIVGDLYKVIPALTEAFGK
ncbi:MAG: electron transfer flavoprotein subunit alpha [Actinobacteria bacterium]|nr:electron transfer flavoprotein subunit alpha [Actinomycetota bacterium]